MTIISFEKFGYNYSGERQWIPATPNGNHRRILASRYAKAVKACPTWAFFGGVLKVWDGHNEYRAQVV